MGPPRKKRVQYQTDFNMGYVTIIMISALTISLVFQLANACGVEITLRDVAAAIAAGAVITGLIFGIFIF